VHTRVLQVLAGIKPAFMKQLREMDGEVSKIISDEEAEELFTMLGERVSAEDARVEIEQTSSSVMRSSCRRISRTC
jgi:hypothetical protein